MADSTIETKLEDRSKPVQELLINNGTKEQIHKYIYKGNDRDTINESLPLADIPVIDLANLSSLSSTRDQELQKLKLALSLWGCFQAVNHGMASSFLDEVREITNGFFELTMEEKQRYSRPVDGIEGYGNDMVLSEHQILDWTDRLYLTLHPEEKRNLKYWPEKPANFREILHEFTMKCKQINETLLKDLAKSLNLEENCFLDQCGEGATMFARFNLYPQCPRPDLILALKPHADGTAVTILLQDKEVEGLQIMRNNQWFRAATIPDALFINIGDQVEIMTNGIFESPVHRVVTNLEKQRISLAIFYIPEPDKEIEPAPGLVGQDRPKLYKTVKNYVDIYFQNYQQGKRPIDAAKI